MSQALYVEARNGDKPDAILCEFDEQFYEGAEADQHIAEHPDHIVTPLRLEVA